MSIRQKVNNTIKPSQAWTLAFGTPPPSGKVFCPFHDNTKTPAAKLYDYGLRCFGTCNRVYTSYDILQTFNPKFLEQFVGEAVIPNTPKPKRTQVSNQLEFTLESYYGN